MSSAGRLRRTPTPAAIIERPSSGVNASRPSRRASLLKFEPDLIREFELTDGPIQPKWSTPEWEQFGNKIFQIPHKASCQTEENAERANKMHASRALIRDQEVPSSNLGAPTTYFPARRNLRSPYSEGLLFCWKQNSPKNL